MILGSVCCAYKNPIMILNEIALHINLKKIDIFSNREPSNPNMINSFFFRFYFILCFNMFHHFFHKCFAHILLDLFIETLLLFLICYCWSVEIFAHQSPKSKFHQTLIISRMFSIDALECFMR